MAAVEAFDSVVSPVAPVRLLEPEAAEVSVDEVRDMHSAWSTEAVTEAERDVCRDVFYSRGHGGDLGEHTMRARTLEVFRRTLAQSGGPCSAGGVRRILASWRYPTRSAPAPPPDPSAADAGPPADRAGTGGGVTIANPIAEQARRWLI